VTSVGAAFAATFLLAAGGVQAAPPCTPYGAAIVLTGTIVRPMFYGPPNFGEDPKHDERGFYPVFHPDRTPHMCPEPPDGAAIPPGADHPRAMQMIFLSGDPRRWYGRHVSVTAKLWTWDNAMHHTPVMLDLVAIRAVGRM
jgi:uncharacterized protein DUF4431